LLGSPAPQQQQHPTPTPPLPQPPLHSLLQLQFSGAAEAYYHRLLAARSKPIEALRFFRELQTRPSDGRSPRGSPRDGTQDFDEFSPRDGRLRSHKLR
jgi:hypothetical protein